MKKFFFIKKFLIIIFFIVTYGTSAQSFSNYSKYMGQGELKIPKDVFDLLEFYFSGGKYGEIYNNPKYDWEKELIKKFNWNGAFVVMSQNGMGFYWYINPHGERANLNYNYLGQAVKKCRNQGYGECFVFAIKNKIVWQNGINTKKGTKIKKKEARKGMLSAKLKELGFYDGGITETKKIEKNKIKKKVEEKKQPDEGNDIVKKLKDLKELYESGSLTKEEFEKAKKKILN
jgi:hypothetical protein